MLRPMLLKVKLGQTKDIAKIMQLPILNYLPETLHLSNPQIHHTVNRMQLKVSYSNKSEKAAFLQETACKAIFWQIVGLATSESRSK